MSFTRTHLRLAQTLVGTLLLASACTSTFRRDIFRATPNNLAFALAPTILLFEDAQSQRHPTGALALPVMAPGTLTQKETTLIERLKTLRKAPECDRKRCLVVLEPTERLYTKMDEETRKVFARFLPRIRLVPEPEAGIVIRRMVTYRTVALVSQARGFPAMGGGVFDYVVYADFHIQGVARATGEEVFRCGGQILSGQRTVDVALGATGAKGIESLENLILYGLRDWPYRSSAGALFRCAKSLGEEIGP